VADIAGFVSNPPFAIEGFGQDAGHTGLTHSAGTAEQKGVGHAAGIYGVLQGATDVILSGQISKGLGAVFPGQDFIMRAVGQESEPHGSTTTPASRRRKILLWIVTDSGIGKGSDNCSNDLQAHMIAGFTHGTRRGPLPLLPSGPGGVHGLPLRGTRLSYPPASDTHLKRARESIQLWT